jgi:hypothetical protein
MEPMEFELTEIHIKLLQGMYVYFDDFGYDGAPAVDLKRPYGNSDTVGDVYEILYGEQWDYDEYEEMPDEVISEMLKLHRETGTALQIVLYTKSFEPGIYYRPRYHTREWVKK